MVRAYGTPVRLHDLEGTQAEAVKRLKHCFAPNVEPPCGWHTPPHLFRVEAVRYAGCSLTEWGGEDYYVTDPKLEVHAYEVHKWTEHGATLVQFSGARRQWVDLRSPGKQWASRSVVIAVEQFALRRERQIYILERQLARARQELHLTQTPCPVGLPV